MTNWDRVLPIFFCLFCLSMMPCAAQTPNLASTTVLPPITSPVSNDLKVVCSNFSWDTGRLAETDLTFDFNVEHADGTPVAFASPQGAVGLNGWTDSLSGQPLGSPGQPNFDQGSLIWHARLIGLDPRSKVIHLQFLIRDPATIDGPSGRVTSDFRLENVPLPSTTDSLEPLNKSFTTVWGTTLTLTGVTYSTKAQYGQPSELYNFTIDHSQVPDDNIDLEFTNAYDSGVLIDNMYQMSQQANSQSPTIVVSSAPISTGLHKSVSLEFTARESAVSKLYATKWTPIVFDVPIDTAWPYSSNYTSNIQTSTAVNKIQLRLVHIADAPGRDRFLVYTKSANSAVIFKVTSAAWGSVPVPTPPGEHPLDIFNNIYWNFDHTLIAPNESGSFIRSNNGPSYYPLLFTVTGFEESRSQVLFSNIPVPTPGQTIVLDQKPDKPSPVALRLRSVALPLPRNNQGDFNSDNSLPNALVLTFEYTINDNSSITLALPPESSVFDAEIMAGTSPRGVQSLGTPQVDTNNDTITVDVLPPVAATKTLNFKLVLSKETPTGSPLSFSVSSDGKWTQVIPIPSK